MLLFLVYAAIAACLSSVCDPATRSILPFTGFKVSRVYQLSGLRHPSSMNFLSITHCDSGTVDFDKTVPIKNSLDIDWNRPFCMLKPSLGNKYGYKDEDTVQSSNSSFLGNAYNLLKKLVYHEFDKKMESATSGRLVEYTGRVKQKHHQDIRGADVTRSLRWEARNLVCYKMARRRKYARSNLTFYVPNTFVGALFECPIPKEKRSQILQNIDTLSFLQPFEFTCDPSIARPISPLIADVPLNIWSQAHLAYPFIPSVSLTVPYMSTRSHLDLRFRNSETPDMFEHTWAGKIDVNEDYDYSVPDLDLISQGIAYSSDYMNRLVSLPDLNPNCSAALGGIAPDLTENPDASPQYLSHIFPSLSWDQKLALAFAKSNDIDGIRVHLERLQKFWDRLDD